MVDIARQTVEFLYEENGGIPRDLYLPTIEDIKDEANKFTIDKVRKGTSASIYLRYYVRGHYGTVGVNPTAHPVFLNSSPRDPLARRFLL